MLPPLKWLLARVAEGQAMRMRARFHGLTERGIEVQRNWLLKRLRTEEGTAFGRDRGFASMRTVQDFRKAMPITRYEDYEPYIERVKAGEFTAMFADQPVIMFAMTSGTTASRKYIPVTKQFLEDYRRSWMIWGIHMFEDHRELWFKTMVQIASDWDEFRSKGGIPCGSISGLTAQMQKYVVRKTYCLPPAAAKLKDVRAKYYLAWRLGLVRDVGLMVSANPSTMVSMARFGAEYVDDLIRDVHDGGLSNKHEFSTEIHRNERGRLKPNRKRARELEETRKRTGGFRPRDVWPQLGLLGNWTGGSVGAYMRHYGEYFGKPHVRDIGLIASEGRMTIPIHDNTPGGILDVSSGFFEFVPVAEMESKTPTILEAHELEEGRDYYILLTTSSGLYRYNIFDVVRCQGRQGQAPVLAFLNKGSSFSNLTGEKLSEHQAVKAVEKAIDKFGLQLAAFSIAPCWAEPSPYYGLFVEESDFVNPEQANQFVVEVEAGLCRENSEYESKRDTLRLAPLALRLLPKGAWREWDRQRLARTGGTAEQYKHPCLIPDIEFEKTFR